MIPNFNYSPLLYNAIGGLGNGPYRQSPTQAYGNSLVGTYPGQFQAIAPSQFAAQAHQLAFAQQYAQLAYAGLAGQAAQQYAPPPPLEYAGITAGEIIAWRCWRVTRGWLQSMATDAVWVPNTVMEGKIEDGLGVHAWKKCGQAIEYGLGNRIGMIVVGTVKLWGEVVEHEIGYRAENAKVNSLDHALGWFPLTSWKLGRLCKKYCV